MCRTGDIVIVSAILFWFRFAYVEFGDKESVETAAALDDSLFRGRQIKVRHHSS